MQPRIMHGLQEIICNGLSVLVVIQNKRDLNDGFSGNTDRGVHPICYIDTDPILNFRSEGQLGILTFFNL